MVYLTLEIDGNAVEGESTKAGFDRVGTIECYSFRCGVVTPREEATGQLTGRRQHQPIVITKKIDKATPLLLKALCQNEPVTVATFRFFRLSGPPGQRAEEYFYTVQIEDGYVSGITQVSERAVLKGEPKPPMLEEVKFVFQDITWTYEEGGATHQDTWRGEAD